MGIQFKIAQYFRGIFLKNLIGLHRKLDVACQCPSWINDDRLEIVKFGKLHQVCRDVGSANDQ